MSEQYQFQFKDWKDAFLMFYHKKAKDAAFCLVISTGDYNSGYWIEKDAKSAATARVYRSLIAVAELQTRIEIALAETKERLGYEPLSLGRIVY